MTAILGRLDLNTGICALLSAGHPPPLLVRHGEVQAVELPPNYPLGIFPDASYDAGQVTLRPGDRLVLVTDGMRDRNAARLDLPATLTTLTSLHPREAVRELADAVLKVAGPKLADDATVLILDWYGHHGQPRNTDAGADPTRASPPLPG
jgi:serine phosphatase RsbU (regulator of sigma subunit)